MSEEIALEPLSQVARVVDTYVAPGKTFTDIRRDASWWLPCLLVLVFSVLAIGMAVKKVGIEQMRDGMLKAMPAMRERIESSPPEVANKIRLSFENSIRRNIYTIPITLLISGFIVGGLFMATANFAFGGTSKYWQMVAVFWYSLLPFVIANVLMTVLVMAGVGIDNYNPQNPLGTNIGYYMEGSSPVLVALLSALDLFSIWIFILQAIGISKVARVSKAAGFGVAIVWWAIYTGVVKLLPALFFG